MTDASMFGRKSSKAAPDRKNFEHNHRPGVENLHVPS